MPMLVVVGGLPGTGKSTLARGIGEALGAPVYVKDVIEASLWRNLRRALDFLADREAT